MPYGDVEKSLSAAAAGAHWAQHQHSQALEQVAGAAGDGTNRRSKLIDLARRLEGCARHSSVRAAGVVISPRPLRTGSRIGFRQKSN